MFLVTNTWFKNHLGKSWTWNSSGDRTRNKIDLMLIQQRFGNSLKSAKSMPGAHCGSDHVPVIAYIKLTKARKVNA